jgi:hypothetical protein
MAGGSTALAANPLSGVPSTGQKLNLSANCSWQVEQVFIIYPRYSRPSWGKAYEKRAFLACGIGIKSGLRFQARAVE